MKELLQDELRYRASIGQKPVTLGTIRMALKDLGYKMDRTMDCRSVSRWMTGPRAGTSYPAVTTEIREADTGLSFANVNARRDDNYRKLQALRLSGELFAVVRGYILGI